MEKHIKAKIDKLVEVYLNYAASVAMDAGWHAPGSLENLKLQSSRKSDLRVKQVTARIKSGTEGAGNDRADDKMIKEISFLRNKHHDYKLAEMLLGRLTKKGDKYVTALIAKQYLQQVYKRPFNDRQAAEKIHEKLDRYRRNRKQAYVILAQAIEFIDEYNELKQAS